MKTENRHSVTKLVPPFEKLLLSTPKISQNSRKSISTHFSADNEDFDREEIATYEEVARLFPRADFKRPVVLVGPPGVGR